MKQHLTLIISGRVQGVLFRDSARRKAKKLRLTGFVRNEPDSSVYIEAEGEENSLKEFLAWCEKGPFLARVENVSVAWLDTLKGFKEFVIEL